MVTVPYRYHVGTNTGSIVHTRIAFTYTYMYKSKGMAQLTPLWPPCDPLKIISLDKGST